MGLFFCGKREIRALLHRTKSQFRISRQQVIKIESTCSSPRVRLPAFWACPALPILAPRQAEGSAGTHDQIRTSSVHAFVVSFPATCLRAVRCKPCSRVTA